VLVPGTMKGRSHRAQRPERPASLIKFLLYCAAALPILAFVRSIMFKRSRALRQASEDFNRQVGYLAIAMLAVAGLALVFYIYQSVAGR
jgi:hypothetical protein